MSIITNYDTLQTAIVAWADRAGHTQFVADVPTMIQLAESAFKRDKRLRRIQNTGTFNIQADGDALPTDYMSMDSFYLNGPTYYGEIDIVPAGLLPEYKLRHGATGVPRAATPVNGTLLYGPVPNASYNAVMVYNRRIVELSAEAPTNWLLSLYPDIYLYGALVHGSAYLVEDNRIQLWTGLLEKALSEVEALKIIEESSGSIRRTVRPIGG